MIRIIPLALAVAVLSLPAQAATAPSLSPADAQRARESVQRLGDERYEIRSAASAALMQLGLAAKPYLVAGVQSDDLEVRRRCRELLPAVFEADLQQRIAAFLADKDGKRDHDLPGWRRFCHVAGDEPAARLLFVEIIKSEQGKFVAEADARPEGAGDVLAARSQALQQSLYNPQFGGPRAINVAEVAALLFVGSDDRVRAPVQSVYMLNGLFYQPNLRAAITGGGASAPLKRLLVSWMNAQTDSNAIQQILYVAMNLELKEALSIAVRLAGGPKKLEELKGPINPKEIGPPIARGHVLGLALTAVGKLGGKDHLPLLEKYLDDTTVIGNFNFNQIRGTTEVRDIALAMMVHLAGQSHKDYGFAFPRTSPGLKFNPHYLGFSQPAERDAALKKWKDQAAAPKK